MRVASLAVCVFSSALLLIPRASLTQHGAVQKTAPVGLEREIKRVEAEIDNIFADTLGQLRSIPVDEGNRQKRVQTLGKLMLFDKQLSVNKNEACTFCHTP